ncbi:Dabb family protein [Salmonella enterica]
MIKHILLMKFNDNISGKQLSQVQNAFFSFSATISGVLSVEWGINNSTEGKSLGFTHCATMTFMDELTRTEYLSHKTLFEFKKMIKPHLADIIIFDYNFGRFG